MDSFDWKKSLGGLAIVLVIGTIGFLAKSQSRPGSNSDTKSKSTATAQKYNETNSSDEFDYSVPYKTIKVDISGQIAKPGVYEITEGSRLDDLVKLAGGLKATADRDAVNLAVKLQDEQKVVILAQNQTIGLDEVAELNGSIRPLASESTDRTPARTSSSKKSKSNKESVAANPIGEKKDPMDGIREVFDFVRENRNPQDKSSQTETARTFKDPYANAYSSPQEPKSPSLRPTLRVNVNRATAADLEALPGIGPTMARRIIDYRQVRGRFSSIDDLRNVKGVGSSVFRKLSPWLTL